MTVTRSYKFKTIAYAAPDKWLKDLVKQLKESEYEVKTDYKMGEALAFLDGVEVFRAMEMNPKHWVVRAAEGLFTEVEEGEEA